MLTAITTLNVFPTLGSSADLDFPVNTIFTNPKSLVSETFTELNNLNVIVQGFPELTIL